MTTSLCTFCDVPCVSRLWRFFPVRLSVPGCVWVFEVALRLLPQSPSRNNKEKQSRSQGIGRRLRAGTRHRRITVHERWLDAQVRLRCLGIVFPGPFFDRWPRLAQSTCSQAGLIYLAALSRVASSCGLPSEHSLAVQCMYNVLLLGDLGANAFISPFPSCPSVRRWLCYESEELPVVVTV